MGAVLTAGKHQRHTVAIMGPHDATDQDDMIAGFDPVLGAALEDRETAIEDRAAVDAEPEVHAVELVDLWGGEVAGDTGLLLRQDIDGKAVRRQKFGQRARRTAQAPEHQRRLQRHGREGVRRHALEAAPLCSRGDDGDAGRKPSERLAQRVLVGPGLGEEVEGVHPAIIGQNRSEEK